MWKEFFHILNNPGDRAAAVGEHYELLATTRAEDGSELGLTYPIQPVPGWLEWFRKGNRVLEQRLAADALTAEPGHVLVPSPVPAPPPGLTEPKYRNAAQLIAAYEGRPIEEEPIEGAAWPTSESLHRFFRSHYHWRFDSTLNLVVEQLGQLLDDSVGRPELIERTLGHVEVTGRRTVREALGHLLERVRLNASSLPSFAEVPMNRWEVRFRFPELCDLFGGTAAGLTEAAEAFRAQREPCRVLLPPVIGEIRELVALLPHDQDLAYALAHLGMDATMTASRQDLVDVANDLTAHIWRHEDERSC